MTITKKVLTLGTIFSAFLGTANGVMAETEKSGLSHKHEQMMLQLKRRTLDDEKQLSSDEMMSDLRDVRLSLGQVKQQAVNLFLESTRVVIKPTDTPLTTNPTIIKASMVSKKSHYLPPRKEWLVFYVNALEPIIHLLTDDIHDVDTNGRKCSEAIEKQINPMWGTWKNDVFHMKKSLDKVQELIEPDSDTNIPLAQEAIAIFDKASELEKTRLKAYAVLQKNYKAATKVAKKTSKH